MNFTDGTNKEIIQSVFPDCVNHVTLEGKVEAMPIFDYFATHFSLHVAVLTPRVMINFLEHCLSHTKEYYHKNPNERVMRNYRKQFPLFKRDAFSLGYKDLQNDMWETIIKHSGDWTRWVTILKKKKSNHVMSYKQIRKMLNAENDTELQQFLSFLRHNGVLNCENAEQPPDHRNYSLPILFKEVAL